MLALQTHDLEFECPAAGSQARLKMAVKKYSEQKTDLEAEAGVTLLFAHCIGAHKEQWEPTIHEVFKNQSKKPPYLRIREAYSFDRQNHGESARLNREALDSRQSGISSFEWAPAIVAFIREKLAGHRLVMVGHSAGSVCSCLVTRDLPPTSFAAIILVEPMILNQEEHNETQEARLGIIGMMVNAISRRRELWSSKEAAFEWMRKKQPWREWDERVLRVHVKHGLYLPDPSSPEVRLKTTIKYEASCYPDLEASVAGFYAFARACKQIPFHAVYGKNAELIDQQLKDDLHNEKLGTMIASSAEVDNAGHLVPQDNPSGVASAICKAIDSSVLAPRKKWKVLL